MNRKLKRALRARNHHRNVLIPKLVRQKKLAVELARVDTASIETARLNARALGGTVNSAFFRTTGRAENRPVESYPPEMLAAMREVINA